MHPCDAERIDSARAYGAPSLFKLEGEARVLFADLPALSREATLHHYEKISKLDGGGMRFATVEESVARLQAKSAGAAAMRSLFHGSPEFVAEWVKFPARDPVSGEGAEGECALDGSKEELAYRAAAEKARLHFGARTIRDAGVKVNVKTFQLREDGVGAVRSEQAASEGALAVKMAALNRAAKPAIAALERSAGLVWNNGPTYFIFENGAFFSGEVRDLWRLAVAFSESLDDIRRMRLMISALELVRLNLRLFRLANCEYLLDDLEADAEKLAGRVKARIAGVVMEGDEASPTTEVVQGLVTRERGNGEAGLEALLRNAEAVRVWVLVRLAHFATAYGSRPKEEAQAAEAAD
jgi:hypothetical protein